jgi:aryl-alcohol dehydrogenase-like predicted oxidoreductase
LSIGFVLAHPEVDVAILGTHNPSHMASNIRLVEKKLPLATEAVEHLHRVFDGLGQGWTQLT